MTIILDQHTVRKLTLNTTVFLGVFLKYDGLEVSRVQTVANSPLALWHAGVEPNKVDI